VRVASSLLIVCALAVAARAQGSAADIAFKKGRELLKAGNYAEACEQFEKSQALDPQLGTQFNIAQCDEKIGKLADALVLYREIADHDTNAQRRGVAIDLAAQLDKRVPRVQIQIEPANAPVTVKLGGHAVACTRGRCDTRIDRGHYRALASSPGFRDASASVDVEAEGATVIVKLALVVAPKPPPEPEPPPPPKPEPPKPEPPKPEPVAEEPPAPETPPRSHRKVYGVTAISVGGASLVTGLVFGGLAQSAWSDAKAACGGTTTCTGQGALDRANALRDTANLRASLSTGFVLGGLALAGIGIALYVTAPSETAVTVAPTGNGVAVSGRF
jgi:hypothetical protein